MQLDVTLNLTFRHSLHFGRDVLDPGNTILATALGAPDAPPKVLAFADTQVLRHWPQLAHRLKRYARMHGDCFELVGSMQPVIGGELCKNDRDAMYRILHAIDQAQLDRHSRILAIGGGAVLDCVGFAAAIAHRGMPLVRLATTTLAQADSAVGVKNGINGFGQKNYLGTFAVPAAVIHDTRFLTTLSDTHWRSGFSEAVKVALIRDAAFFDEIMASAPAIAARDLDAAEPIIMRSAQLHLQHIAASGDPFELTSTRPLDFGHWSAHRLEVLSDYQLTHGHAVAIGIALDTRYSMLMGYLPPPEAHRVFACLDALGFACTHPLLQEAETLLEGLEQFRMHLGGRLTLTMLKAIGEGFEVHTIDQAVMRQALDQLLRLGATTRTSVC